MNKALLLIVACLFVFYCQCTQPYAGGSSQQGNGKIVGCVVLLDGSPAKKVTIRICPVDFLKKPLSDHKDNSVVQSTTDNNGRFALNGLLPGSYAIEVNDLSSVAVMSKTSINEVDSTSDLGTLCLKPYARISGSISRLSSGSSTANLVQIKGLDRYAQLNDDGSFVFNDLPEGRFELRVVSGDSTIPTQIVSGIKTRSECSESIVVPSGWRYGHRFTLNTTATGADISERVTHFPLLVRLTQDNFDFSQASSDGSDIRFIGKGSTFLSHEIESWSKDSRLGEVWINVDTVYSADSTQSITMFWGNDAAPQQTNAAGVFDRSYGYAGVWHLNEKSGNSATDVSGNNFSGTYAGGLPNSEIADIGQCQRIEKPDSDYIDMGNVLNIDTNDISIGVWIKQGSHIKPQALISKTNGDLPSTNYGYLLSIGTDNQPRFNIAMGGSAWGDDSSFEIAGSMTIPDTVSWHYICVVIDRTNNGNCKMYFDGIDRTGIITGTISSVPAISNLLHFRIGAENDNNCSFKGSISEAVISLTTRSSSWVKLSYMNQKSQDNLVKW
jgi:hypothetical protein